MSFDSCLNMEAQISNTCKSAFYMLYNHRRIRKYLDQTNAETHIHAFISSKIDYCNGLLYGLPDTQIIIYNAYNMPVPDLYVIPQNFVISLHC